MQAASGQKKADEPVYPTAIAGYRIFQVGPDRRLHSVHMYHAWEPGINRAVCLIDQLCPFPDLDQRTEHRAPAADCSCGLQAFYHLDQAEDYLTTHLDQETETYLIGLIAGAGSVRLHQLGWRAQQAQILGLLTPRAITGHNQLDSGRRRQLEDGYKVPICTSAEQLQMPAQQLPLMPADQVEFLGKLPGQSFFEALADTLELQYKGRDCHGS